MLMRFWPSSRLRGCLPLARAWSARLRTGRAIALLIAACLLVALVPFRLWRGWLGPAKGRDQIADLAAARRLASHVGRAAWRMPFAVKCLPQAMALSWQLRRRRFAHRIVFVLRPPHLRGQADALHAWIACGDEIVLGDLPGPWLVVHAIPAD